MLPIADAIKCRKICRDYGIEFGSLSTVILNYQNVVAELTGGKMSKPTYSVSEIVDEVQHQFCKDCDKTMPVKPDVTTENGKKHIKCGACGKGLRPNDKYCPYCGTKVGEVD